jgi:hypothetical protein
MAVTFQLEGIVAPTADRYMVKQEDVSVSLTPITLTVCVVYVAVFEYQHQVILNQNQLILNMTVF